MMVLTFEDYRKRALDSSLKSYEKIGFGAAHRAETEKNIFPDMLSKVVPLRGQGKLVLDIGCGCSAPVLDLIRHCEEQGHRLILNDCQEMLDLIPDSPNIIEKAAHEFPKDTDFLERWHHKVDVIICYSVIHGVYLSQNVYSFIDKAVGLLGIGGVLLIGDIANITKKKRFLSSDAGLAFHKQWSGDDSEPKINWVEEYEGLDDCVIALLLFRYRSMGLETYLLPQREGLPMSHTREDILICRH